MNKLSKKENKIKETDKPINVRLEDHFEITDASTIEKRLDGNRVEEKNTLIENLLESRRSENKQAVTEKLLNDTKGSYGNKIRNSDAYEGDFNILDQERVAKKKAAQDVEKAELASETPKKKKWWEEKSEDGLKIANIQHKEVKVAQQNFEEDYDFGNLEEDDYNDDFDDWDNDENNLDDVFEGEEDDSNVYLINSGDGFYEFGVIDDSVDEEITKQNALDRVLELKPELELSIGMESVEPFSTNPRTGETIVKVLVQEDGFEVENLDTGDSFSFEKINLEKIDAGGTPVISGEFAFKGFEGADISLIARDASEFLSDEYSLDIDASDIIVSPSKGTIQFVIEENVYAEAQRKVQIKTAKKK